VHAIIDDRCCAIRFCQTLPRRLVCREFLAETPMKGSAARSALRTFEILEYFRRVRKPLRLKDVAESLHFPPSSTAELLKAASDRGYLTFDPMTRTYYPAARLAALGDWITESLYERGALLAKMKDLHSIAGDCVILAMVNGFHVEYVEVLEPF